MSQNKLRKLSAVGPQRKTAEFNMIEARAMHDSAVFYDELFSIKSANMPCEVVWGLSSLTCSATSRLHTR